MKSEFNKIDFFEKYHIEPHTFEDAGCNWDMLEEIYDDYHKSIHMYEEPAHFIINKMMRAPNVHSVRYRIKKPEHLIEKIIRKRINNPDKVIDIHNYTYEITDLIGIRALYLFKNDWSPIHNFIINEWEMTETPTLYYRDGDSETYIQDVCSAGCDAKEHKYGYRSLHYLINMQPFKTKFTAEVQIRTIFEEAWSEIDHNIRYPYFINHPVFLNQLLILNRLAGTADELSTYMQDLQNTLRQSDENFKKEIQKKESIISSVTEKIHHLKKHLPAMEEATHINKDNKENISLTAEEIEWLSFLFSKIKGVKRIHIDTDADGTPDTFLIDDEAKGRIIGFDKDQDGTIDYYIKI